MTPPLRVGVALPHSAYAPVGDRFRWAPVRDLAVDLEQAGFDALWASDHFYADFRRSGGPAGTYPQLDALVALPALATVTTRVTLGTLVLAIGFRAPSVVAKAAASLDRLSGGRFELGVGAGWREDEYHAAGLPFPPAGERLTQLEEGIALIREMLRNREATVHGDRFRVDGAPNLPVPVRPDLPILVTAFGPRALRVAARRADRWNVAWRFSPEEYGRVSAQFGRACEEVGRDPAEVGRSVGLLTLVGENRRDLERRFAEWRRTAPWAIGEASMDEFARRALVGTPQHVLGTIAEFRQLGVTDLVMNFGPIPFGWSSAAGWDMVAEGVLPALRD